MESSWYSARYTCMDNDEAMLDERADYWLPVDQYVGGIEHAILHLLYARFYHKLLRDEGLVKGDEPFAKLLTQGMVLKDGSKMSKSKGNTVDPQELIAKYGADTVRLFTIFASPPEQSLEWNDDAVEGAHRFLKRVWGFEDSARFAEVIKDLPATNWAEMPEQLKSARRNIHESLKQALVDFDKYQFNTVVAACMKIMNVLDGCGKETAADTWLKKIEAEGFSILLRLLAPVAPHISHTVWRDLGYGDDILMAAWPEVDALALIQDEIEMVVQVNGKLRGKVTVAAGASKESVEQAAMADYAVSKYTAGKQVRKVIVVPGKLVNIVVA
jgi:leucyl-tRNA synthetase